MMGRMGYGYGSEFHLLRWMGRHREQFDKAICGVLDASEIRWLDFNFDRRKDIPDAELRGLEFLDVKNDRHAEVIKAFQYGDFAWPKQGEKMNWDAVGVVGETFVLCEAKAHIAEIEPKYDPGTSPSAGQRERAFAFAKKRIGARLDADWLHTYYQMANRLYILALLDTFDVKSVLLNIYFCGDGFRDRDCPANRDGWMKTINHEMETLGIANSLYVQSHVKHIFLPVAPIDVENELSTDRISMPLDCF